MSATDGERAAFLRKQASYARIRAMLQPNRGVKLAPPPVDLPPRKKARAAA